MTTDQHPELWGRAAALRTSGLIAVGSVIWFVGWYRVAGEGRTEDQGAPFNLAAFGVLLAGAGMVSWFLEGRRAVGQKRRALIGELRPSRSHGTRTQTAVAPATVLVGDGRYYHRPECAIASGREMPAATRSAHEAASRTACGVCRP